MDIAGTGTQRTRLKKAINPKARVSDAANDSADEDTPAERPQSPPPPGTGKLIDKFA